MQNKDCVIRSLLSLSLYQLFPSSTRATPHQNLHEDHHFLSAYYPFSNFLIHYCIYPSIGHLRNLITVSPFYLQASEESNQLIHCPFSVDIWNSVLDQFGMSWVMLLFVAKLYFAWEIVSVSSNCASLWHFSLFFLHHLESGGNATT